MGRLAGKSDSFSLWGFDPNLFDFVCLYCICDPETIVYILNLHCAVVLYSKNNHDGTI